MSYETVIQYMDAVNRRVFEFLIVENGLSEKKALVDECVEVIREDGHSIHKSALHQRMGLKRNRYKDGHWFQEMKALNRMSEEAKENYASIPSGRYNYRLKREIVTAVNMMTDEELAFFNALSGLYKRIMFAKRIRKQLPIALPRGIIRTSFDDDDRDDEV